MISSELYAQEIEENKSNEILEALMIKTSIVSKTEASRSSKTQDSAKRDFCVKSNKMNSSTGAISKKGFSYTENSKPKLFLKPRRDNQVSYQDYQHSGPLNSDKNALSNPDFNSKNLFKSKEPTYANSEAVEIHALPNLSENNALKFDYDDGYINVDEIENNIEPPPLPSRPPPVFKYPLGMFCNKTYGLREPDIVTNEKHSDLCDKTFQNESIKSTKYSLSSEENVTVIPKRSISVPFETEVNKHQNPMPLRRDLRIGPLIARPVSAPVPTQISKPPKPLPKPSNSRDVQLLISKSLPKPDEEQAADITMAEREKVGFPSRIKTNKVQKPSLIQPNSETVENRFEGILSHSQINSIRKTSFASDTKLEVEKVPSLKAPNFEPQFNGARPKVPNKPNSSIQQKIEKILADQITREKAPSIPPSGGRKLSSEEILFPFYENFPMEINGVEKQSSLDSSFEPKLDDEIQSPKLHSRKSLDSPIESPSPIVRNERKGIRSEEELEELRNSLIRPALPQKIKKSHRSLSYSSLVQTVKDISSTLWSSTEKSKRHSTEVNPKIMEDVVLRNELTSAKHVTTASTGITKDPQPIKFAKNTPAEEKTAVQHYHWFHDVSASEAQQLLLKLNEDCAFLIRPSSRPTDQIQFTACILYNRRVFNIYIRRLESGHYVLGGQRDGEKSFSKLLDLVQYYEDFPFEIHPVSLADPHSICFGISPPR